MCTHTHTWVQPEEACRAAKILPGESWIFVEVINEHFIQSLGHIGSIQNIWIYGKREGIKFIFDCQSDVLYSIWKGIQAVCVCSCFCTSVVDISRDLYVTQLRVDW